MSKDNPISTAVSWYADHGPNPLLTTLLLGGGAYGLTRLAWNPSVEVLRHAGKPLGKKLLGGDANPNAELEWEMAMDNLKKDKDMRRWLPLALGGGLALGTAYLIDNPYQPWRGFARWMWKSGNFQAGYSKVQDMGMDSYVDDPDWNAQVSAADIMEMFRNDRHLEDSPYVRNVGIAITASAALKRHTRRPTVGDVYDAAVEKIENRLRFNGMDESMCTKVANAISKLFVNSLCAILSLSLADRQKLIDDGSWANAVTSMLG